MRIYKPNGHRDHPIQHSCPVWTGSQQVLVGLAAKPELHSVAHGQHLEAWELSMVQVVATCDRRLLQKGCKQA